MRFSIAALDEPLAFEMESCVNVFIRILLRTEIFFEIPYFKLRNVDEPFEKRLPIYERLAGYYSKKIVFRRFTFGSIYLVNFTKIDSGTLKNIIRKVLKNFC